jgi:hypothetical protein
VFGKCDFFLRSSAFLHPTSPLRSSRRITHSFTRCLCRKQLDLEAAAREEGLYRGLGCFTGPNTYTSPFNGRETVFPASGWHSGRVEFKATIVTLSPSARSAAAFASNQSQTHTLRLHKPRLGKSSMLSRVVDSEDYIVIKPSKPPPSSSSLQKEKKPHFEASELALLRTRLFVIFDKAYGLFCGKHDGAYLVSFKQSGNGMGSLMRFGEALRAFNDTVLNSGQVGVVLFLACLFFRLMVLVFRILIQFITRLAFKQVG